VLNKFSLLLRYIRYYFSAQTKFDIHSPFVFDLVTQIFNKDEKSEIFKSIEQRRKELLYDKTLIQIRDYGAGFGGIVYKSRTISYITQNSTKPGKYARLLYRLVKYYKPKKILELGTSVGISSVYQAFGNTDSQLITIEGCENTSSLAQTTFKNLDVKNIVLVNDEFESALDKIFMKYSEIDYVFIDGNHRKEPTLRYFDRCLKQSHEKTIFIIDDINWSCEMREAWKEIQQHPRVKITIDLFMMGIVFINPDFSKENFTIRF
jgi:predicted O-methyltransferase YrrM